MTFTVPCPAKVNLFLTVGPPDRRGYHPLRTVFQAIDLCDTLTLSVSEGEPSVVFEGAEVPAENTVTKALRLLAEIAPLPPLRIEVTKRIPMESGLGGGSSDAAGLMRAAQHLLGAKLPKAELEGVALAVGADVPFFLVGGRAKAEGYGERLSPLPDTPREWLVVLRPEVGCPTGDMYRKLDEKEREWRDFDDRGFLYNDFERVAPCECLDWIERLRIHGAQDAALSGSGSAVFGRFPDRTTAQIALDSLRGEGAPHAWIARTLTRAESLAVVKEV
jgi:4-diphosphocytidyl-2-C-methyl-D-erythritol kinase